VIEKERVAELVMMMFDRLEKQFPNGQVEDAVLLVESLILMRPQRLTMERVASTATPSWLESTAERMVIQMGIVEFARRTMYESTEQDGE
jgi:hypothetical protein